MNYSCIMCGAHDLEILENIDREMYVTGNRKKYLNYSCEIEKVICKNCGHIQHLQNEVYRKSVEAVFHHYGILHNKSFQNGFDKIKMRENLVIEKIVEALQLSEQGNMLDIGCGGGEALGYFHEYKPKWNLYGMEISTEFKNAVLAHAGVKGFFSALHELVDSNIKFDLITINYVMSVANNPYEILSTVKKILSETGILFMIDTDFEVHPYSLGIIEHSSFWNKASFESACLALGFDLISPRFEHERKEIWAFCKKGDQESVYENLYCHNKLSYNNAIRYLENVIKKVINSLKEEDHIGIFGMSCAGIWVYEVINKYCMSPCKDIFWIEEDEEVLSMKAGVDGYPIKRIAEIKEKAIVFLPFPTYIAYGIKERLEKENEYVEFVLFD